VREMMSFALAQSLVTAHTHHEQFDPLRDCYALRALAVWCLRFSPTVGLDHELSQRLVTPSRHCELAAIAPQHYGITIDLTGTERVNGTPHTLCATLQRQLSGALRIAVAPSLGGAWALSRYSVATLSVAPSLDTLTSLTAVLPVRALRLDSVTCDKLSDVGVYTIGDLARFPRQSLGQRFGKALLFRLAQLSGAVSEHVPIVTEMPQYREHAVFEPPLSHRRAITAALEHLFANLLSELSRCHIAASLFRVSITDTEGTTAHKDLALASATSDRRHLQSIVHPMIESLRFCGEVHSVTLEALETTRLSQSQHTLHGEESQDPTSRDRAYRELLNSLSVRLGLDRVHKACLTPSHVPERSFHYTCGSVPETPPTTARSLGEATPLYGGFPYRSLHSLYTTPFDRPPLLLSPPEPIISIAMLPDKPPSWIRWRGARLSIVNGRGPERIALEWWQGALTQGSFAERDYFTVQDDSGRWLWVFRCRSSRAWFVHGVWT
jgi:protein ImuB